MKLPGTPDTRLSIGLLKPNRDSMKLPINVPIAAPIPATIGVDIKANNAGTITPGLKMPYTPRCRYRCRNGYSSRIEGG